MPTPLIFGRTWGKALVKLCICAAGPQNARLTFRCNYANIHETFVNPIYLPSPPLLHAYHCQIET